MIVLWPLDGILLGVDDGAHCRGSQAVRIAELVRAALMLPDDVGVTVQQLRSLELGCPPVETALPSCSDTSVLELATTVGRHQ
ncbi:hypothetical protein AWC25_11790 [Mycobacterium sherrisii]|uniref:Uncharacterized protein n=1 Tax=Mycobacterium sherrisii TaxID=243061 RepID=A0A1E3SC61_9MYCO|nr:hypothetical protein BHQ21_25105 [Mycobacterium sherrisii]ORW76174.1 hypothetical protein AWC25_11790 [Mycobacterium sherrisii]